MLLKHSNKILTNIIYKQPTNLLKLKHLINRSTVVATISSNSSGKNGFSNLNQQQQQQQQQSTSQKLPPKINELPEIDSKSDGELIQKHALVNDHRKNAIISTKIQAQKLPAPEAIVKNLFLGKVDRDHLTYPEVMERDAVQQLHEITKPTENYFKTIINSIAIDNNGEISREIMNDMRTRLRSFGMDIPQDYGGHGLSCTESLINGELEGIDENIAIILNSHRTVSKLILDYGTDLQKHKYLTNLAGGQQIGSVAMFERLDNSTNTSDSSSTSSNLFQTIGEWNQAECLWTLNGEKTFVINTTDANLFLVFAQTKAFTEHADKSSMLTAFLIERDHKGFDIQSRDKLNGFGAVHQATVKLTNCEVSEDNILGAVGKGDDIAQKLLQLSRLQTGAVAMSMMKKIINSLTRFSIDRKHFQIKFMDMEIVRYRLAKAVNDLYALESMIYLTGQLMDRYDNADLECELAIIEVFAKESLLRIALDSINFMGLGNLESGTEPAKLLKNTLHLYANGELLDSVKFFIGFTGLQYIGAHIHDDIKKVRNPFMHPAHAFKQIFVRQNVREPKSNLKLNEYLHPSLDPAAQWLEKSIVRLHLGATRLLGDYGAEITSKQIDVLRLTDCSILLFAMFASVARASRSYCIGLRHADYEMLMANTFAYDSMETIQSQIEILTNLRTDQNYLKLSNQLFRSFGYFAEHPTNRNF